MNIYTQNISERIRLAIMRQDSSFSNTYNKGQSFNQATFSGVVSLVNDKLTLVMIEYIHSIVCRIYRSLRKTPNGLIKSQVHSAKKNKKKKRPDMSRYCSFCHRLPMVFYHQTQTIPCIGKFMLY